MKDILLRNIRHLYWGEALTLCLIKVSQIRHSLLNNARLLIRRMTQKVQKLLMFTANQCWLSNINLNNELESTEHFCDTLTFIFAKTKVKYVLRSMFYMKLLCVHSTHGRVKWSRANHGLFQIICMNLPQLSEWSDIGVKGLAAECRCVRQLVYSPILPRMTVNMTVVGSVVLPHPLPLSTTDPTTVNLDLFTCYKLYFFFGVFQNDENI